MPKLSPAQIRILKTKIISLIVVGLIFVVLASLFSSNINSVSVINTDDIHGNETNVSKYEKFAIENDIHRGSFIEPNQLTEDNVDPVTSEPSPQISDNTYIENAEIIENFPNYDNEEVYQIAPISSSTLLQNSEDISHIYEQLYEETLVSDIIDSPTMPSKKTTSIDNIPMIAIVIDDMGINQKRTNEIISLKYPLTTSFLTYSSKLDQQTAASIKSGHEIMLHVPMEASTSINVAPDVLTTDMSIDEIKNNFEIMLTKIKGIKGVNNHMGSKFTQDEERMQIIMETLQDKNLFFLDSKTSPKSVAHTIAAKMNVKHASRNVFLDNLNDKEYILKQLELSKKIAAKNGYAIAIAHPKSQTYVALSEWLPQLEKQNFKLVHLSRIIELLNN